MCINYYDLLLCCCCLWPIRLSNHLILSVSLTFMCITGANVSLCRSLSTSSFLPLALPSFVLPVSPGFLFISHCPVGVCLRWRVCRSCPLWQADSSEPDVEPGPAEQIMLTQLSRARQGCRLSWAGCSLALSLPFYLPCSAPHSTRIRHRRKWRWKKKKKPLPALHQLNWASAAAQQ